MPFCIQWQNIIQGDAFLISKGTTIRCSTHSKQFTTCFFMNIRSIFQPSNSMYFALPLGDRPGFFLDPQGDESPCFSLSVYTKKGCCIFVYRISELPKYLQFSPLHSLTDFLFMFFNRLSSYIFSQHVSLFAIQPTRTLS